MTAFHLNLRLVLRNLAFAALLGAGIGIFLWLPNREDPLLPVVLASAWFGVCVYSVCVILLRTFQAPIQRLEEPWRRLSLGALFFVAGCAGFVLGLTTLPLITAGQIAADRPDWRIALTMAGGLGVVMGLSFYSYFLLKERLRQSVEQLKDQEFAEKELQTAREMQSRLLPSPIVEGQGFRVAARNEAARYVAGDFYDVFHNSDGSLGLVVADVAGKGVGASLIMASVKATLPLLAADRSTAETLNELNHRLREQLPARQFVALCLIRFDAGKGDFQLANAGLPDPYLLAAGQPARALTAPGPRLPLGMKTGIEYQAIGGHLEAGERLLLLTDGLPEALTEDQGPLGYEELELLLADGDSAPEIWLKNLFSRVRRRTVARLEDDLTALILERTPSAH